MGILANTGNKLVNKVKLVTNYNETKTGYESIRDMLSFLSFGFLKSRDFRVETFEMAMDRLNVDEEHLKQVHKNYFLSWFLLGLINIIGITMLFVYLYNGKVWGAVASIGYISFVTSYMVVQSFRMFQIKNRELCAFSKWVGTKGSFIPDAL